MRRYVGTPTYRPGTPDSGREVSPPPADTGSAMSRFTEERAAIIRASLETDIRSTLTEHNVHYSPHESLELEMLVDALVGDAMSHIESLLMEVTW